MFLAYQYPIEIPGVSSKYFLKAAINSIRKYHEQPVIGAAKFLEIAKEKMQLLAVT